MKNRWGADIRKGDWVQAHHPRGGEPIEGRVERVYVEPGYGKRAELDTGYSIGLDDVFSFRAISPRMQRTRSN